MTHPRINELPDRYKHPRHFWIFDLPEQETQIWLGRFRLDEQMKRREEIKGPIIAPRHTGT